MTIVKVPERISADRRSFVGSAAMTIAATQLGMIALAEASPGANTSFASPKQINAGLLNIGYAEAGPSTGPAVILLHGWPYDIHSYVDVAPLLASKGYHVVVPYLRGYGTTRFLAGDTVRNARHHRVDGCAQDPDSYRRRV
jgi:hypothetical protein